MQGQRSYPRLVALQNQNEDYQNKLNDLKEQKSNLHRKVTMMRPQSLDLDMLVEQSRSIIGFRLKGEVDYILLD